MKVHTGAFIASSVSGLSLLVSMLFVANIYSDVQSIWRELDAEIGTFRSTTDDLWRDMIKVGAGEANFKSPYDLKSP